jgi:SAM-dependent methyltransferase
VSVDSSSPVPGDRQDVFASGAYWREYYSSLGHENREVGEFLLEAATSLSTARLKILDAGCGPTLLYWAVFIPGDDEVHGFDINRSNLQDNQRQIDDVQRGLFDAGLVEAARHAIRAMCATTTPEHHLADKARQVATLSVADLSQLWPYESEQFDLVQSCFALEALPDWTSFDAALGEARRVLRPGGCLALVNGSQVGSAITILSRRCSSRRRTCEKGSRAPACACNPCAKWNRRTRTGECRVTARFYLQGRQSECMNHLLRPQSRTASGTTLTCWPYQ